MKQNSSNLLAQIQSVIERLFPSSVMLKFLIGLSGSFWVGFVAMHAVLNLPVLFGYADAYNQMVMWLQNIPGIHFIEFFMLGIPLLAHALMCLANVLTRKFGYSFKQLKVKELRTTRSVTGALMPITGPIIFVFLIWHIYTIKFVGVSNLELVNGIPDLYGLMLIIFSNIWNVFMYEFAILMLSSHLTFGIPSMLESIGLIKSPLKTGLVGFFSVLMIFATLEFLAIPILMYLR